MIKENTDKDLIKRIWKGKNPDESFNTFTWLISEEKKHMELVVPFSIGEIQRIM